MEKKSLFTIILLLSFLVANCQIKIFDDNWISVGSLQKGGKGIQIEPDGVASFHPCIYGAGVRMEISYSTDEYVKNWDVKRDYDTLDGFYVDGTGNVWCMGNYLGSDTTFKTKIENIASPLDKLLQLHGVLFNWKKHDTTPDSIRIQDRQGIWHVISSSAKYFDTSNLKPGVLQRMLHEHDMKHMGVLAQEVEKVVPEVVRMQTDGYLGVAYYGLIGLIIEAIKEQQTQILAMNNPAAPLKNDELTDSSSIKFKGDNYLYQNAPNPFSKSTMIKFKVSSSASEGSILIFNMQGTLLKTYKELHSNGEIIIYGRELNPGMYLYSLVVDGHEIDTKRMILTE